MRRFTEDSVAPHVTAGVGHTFLMGGTTLTHALAQQMLSHFLARKFCGSCLRVGFIMSKEVVSVRNDIVLCAFPDHEDGFGALACIIERVNIVSSIRDDTHRGALQLFTSAKRA